MILVTDCQNYYNLEFKQKLTTKKEALKVSYKSMKVTACLGSRFNHECKSVTILFCLQ